MTPLLMSPFLTTLYSSTRGSMTLNHVSGKNDMKMHTEYPWGRWGLSSSDTSVWQGFRLFSWWSECRCSLNSKQLLNRCGAFQLCFIVTFQYVPSDFFYLRRPQCSIQFIAYRQKIEPNAQIRNSIPPCAPQILNIKSVNKTEATTLRTKQLVQNGLPSCCSILYTLLYDPKKVLGKN